MHGVPFRFTEGVDAIEDHRDTSDKRWPRESDAGKPCDYAVVAKLQTAFPSGLATCIVAAGIGAIGTLAACYFLGRNATDLYQEFGSNPFACLLHVPDKTDFRAVESVEQARLQRLDKRD
jgi:hypothetical protein